MPDSLFLWEEAWNAHPYCLTVMTNGYFSMEKFDVAKKGSSETLPADEVGVKSRD